MLLRRFVVLIALVAAVGVAGVIALRKPILDQEVRAWRDRDYQLAWLDDAEIQRNVDAIFTRVAAEMNPILDRHETVTGLCVTAENGAPDAGCVVEIDALKWYGCGCCEYSPEPSTFNDEDFAYISQLAHVNKMTLSLTQVTDVGFRSIERLQGLTWLDMSDGQFTDDALRSVGRLHEIEFLNLSGNRIDGSGLRFLSDLHRLKTLDLSNTDLTDDAMKHLASLPSLEVLLLDRTPITGPGLRHLAGLNRLRQLSMTGCELASDGLSHLPPLPSLEECIANQTLVGRGLAVFEDMPALRSLLLSETNVDDDALAGLAGVVWLQSLGLSDTQVSDDGLRHLSEMTSLKTLNVNRTKACGSGIRHLTACTGLHQFNAYRNQLAAIDLDQTTLDAISSLKQLESLRVRLMPTGDPPPALRLHDMPRLSLLEVICPLPVEMIELVNVPMLGLIRIVGEPKTDEAYWPNDHEDAPPVSRIVIRNSNPMLYRFHIPVPEEFECEGPKEIHGARFHGRLTQQFSDQLRSSALKNKLHLRIEKGSDPQAVADLFRYPERRDPFGSLEFSIDVDEFNADWSLALNQGLSRIPGYRVSVRIRAERLTGDSPISFGGISNVRHLELEGFSGVDQLRISAEDMPPALEQLTIRDAEIGTLEFESCHVPIMALDMRRFDRLLINGYEGPYHNLQLFHDWTRPSDRNSGLLHAPGVVELRDLPYVKYCDMRYGDGVRELRVVGDCPRLEQASYVPRSVTTFPEGVYRGR